MAQFDVQNDTTPHNPLVVNTKPTIAAMRTALNTFSSTTYPSNILDYMTENDMVKACVDNGLTVSGL